MHLEIITYICRRKDNIDNQIMMSNTYYNIIKSFAIIAVALGALSCAKIEDVPEPKNSDKYRSKVDFDVLVTRDGEMIPKHRAGIMSRSAGFESSDKMATMNKDLAFGLVGIDYAKGDLLVDNAKVSNTGNGYSGWFENYLWDDANSVSFSAYYPYVNSLEYGEDFLNYSIPYSIKETEAGPLVSKTVEKAVSQLNMIPLVFQHITNDIGFKICDVTPDPQLQGHIRLRKVTATNVAQAGIYINDVQGNTGSWHRQGFYRSIVVFEGDAPVGVGSKEERFVGFDQLVDRMADSHRYYSIPDDIEIGKQCVEVIYDVDPITIDGYTHKPLKNQVAKYMLYGLLPDNVFVYGKQYTFHLGLDLSEIYKQISFTASVSDWETHIYENNDDF